MASLRFPLIFAFVIALATMHEVSAVTYGIIYKAGNTPGGLLWITQFGEDYTKGRMEAATKHVLYRLSISSSNPTWDTQHVTLIIDSAYSGVAETNHIGQKRVEITMSSKYLQDMKDKGRNVKEAFYGVLVHEMTHVWQWWAEDNQSDESDNVVEGIADYVRLTAGFPDPTWVKPGGGSNWNQRYGGVMARFFDYISLDVNRNFVPSLNKKMKFIYEEDYFRQITGKTVNQLWKNYKHFYNKGL